MMGKHLAMLLVSLCAACGGGAAPGGAAPGTSSAPSATDGAVGSVNDQSGTGGADAITAQEMGSSAAADMSVGSSQPSYVFQFKYAYAANGSVTTTGFDVDKWDLYIWEAGMQPIVGLIEADLKPLLAGGTTIEGTLTVTVSSTKLTVALPPGVSAAVIAGLEGKIATHLSQSDPALGGFVRSANQLPFTAAQLAELDAVGAHMANVYIGKTIGTVTADYRGLLLATLFAFVASIES